MEITLESPHLGILFPAGAVNPSYLRSAVAYAKVPGKDLLVLCNAVEIGPKGQFEISWGLQKPGAYTLEQLIEGAFNQLSEQKETLGGSFMSFETLQTVFQNAPLELLETPFGEFLKIDVKL